MDIDKPASPAENSLVGAVEELLRIVRLFGGAGGVFADGLDSGFPVIGAAEGDSIGGGGLLMASPARPDFKDSRWFLRRATGGVGGRFDVAAAVGSAPAVRGLGKSSSGVAGSGFMVSAESCLGLVGDCNSSPVGRASLLDTC